MALTTDQANAVKRITARLKSTDEATYRAGGRAVALQAIEHRADLVHALRSTITELGEASFDDRRRGYQEALLDVLVAAEAALEPREEEATARRELTSNRILQQVLDCVAPAPVTPGEVAKLIRKSAASAGRYFLQLRSLGLIRDVPNASDARERPNRVTPLGARLAQQVPSSTVLRVRPSADGYLAFCRSVQLDDDPATGLRLIDAFHQRLANQLELHRLARRPLTVMRVDIGNFQEFTEIADFAGVNKFIFRVVETLKKELTLPAEVARYDWDKFVVMLPQHPVEDAKKLVKTLLSKLEPVTAKFGIAEAGATSEVDVDTLLRESSAALQQAKDEGTTFAARSAVAA